MDFFVSWRVDFLRDGVADGIRLKHLQGDANASAETLVQLPELQKQEFLDLEKVMAAWDAENPVITPNQVVEPVWLEAKVVEPVVGPVVETTVPKPVPPQEPTACREKTNILPINALGVGVKSSSQLTRKHIDQLKVIFFTFYNGKSPSNHRLGEDFFRTFCRHLRQIQARRYSSHSFHPRSLEITFAFERVT